MKKLLTDVHTHTIFSPDGKDDIDTMLQTAKELGVAYYGISEHVDYDMKLYGKFYGKPRYTDEDAYFKTGREKQVEYEGVMRVLIGVEFGYRDDEKVTKACREFIEKYKPDFVINSVHTLEGNDYCRGVPYRTENGEIRPKREVYEEYFDLVKRSAEVDYEYDILGHAGYCTRYAPYEDKGASYKEYAKEWDGVLKAVIARDKILEINTSNKLGVSPTLPDRDVLERYYELGGRKVSIGSDAHFKERILDKRDLTVKMLKEIGFTAVTVPDCGKHLQVEI